MKHSLSLPLSLILLVFIISSGSQVGDAAPSPCKTNRDKELLPFSAALLNPPNIEM